jgi:hypothetical protein
MKVDAETLSGVRWVSEKVFAEIHGLSRQTLTNWRYRDRRAGRREAPPGYPQYRYFGSAVRYKLAEDR